MRYRMELNKLTQGCTYFMQHTNHLSTETSPYLLQHAHNPVEWYPWGEAALVKAKKENKPLLLSIGYAACHWCHVMEHESFEDVETAKLMNTLFINVKVDREERPDLDKIYQTAHYLLTQRPGGWPLTVFLAPEDLTPFFSGTYFPRDAKLNLPSFKNVLQTVADLYRNHQQEINQQNQQLLSMLNHVNVSEITDNSLTEQPLNQAMKILEHHYDHINGGFGNAPKFPHPTMLEFLLKHESKLTAHALEKMAEGGIYDQLGGGFFRYTIDAEWRIPHFEKMLYDNAQLIYLYALARGIYHQPIFGNIAYECAEWLLRNMQAPEGGFYSSIDADSEGQEGKYYIWNKFEIRSLLNEVEYSVISVLYGIDKESNFEKHWHLYFTQPLSMIAERMNLSMNEATTLVSSTKETLLATREKRVPPDCDKKILTAWNALTIKALFTASEILQEPRFAIAAERALSFIQSHLWKNKRLLATHKDGKSRFTAYLDDYAFLLDALLTSLATKWHTEHLQFAIELADTLLLQFEDPAGGFYFTANDHEKLIQRPKPLLDEAVPSGNGIAAQALITLGHLLGETRYLEAAEKTLQSAWGILIQFPAEHCSLLLALKDLLSPPYMIIIRGPELDVKSWRDYCKQRRKHRVFVIPDQISQLPGLLASHKPLNKVCAYICCGTRCLTVIDDFEKLKDTLSSGA